MSKASTVVEYTTDGEVRGSTLKEKSKESFCKESVHNKGIWATQVTGNGPEPAKDRAFLLQTARYKNIPIATRLQSERQVEITISKETEEMPGCEV